MVTVGIIQVLEVLTDTRQLLSAHINADVVVLLYSFGKVSVRVSS